MKRELIITKEDKDNLEHLLKLLTDMKFAVSMKDFDEKEVKLKGIIKGENGRNLLQIIDDISDSLYDIENSIMANPSYDEDEEDEDDNWDDEDDEDDNWDDEDE